MDIARTGVGRSKARRRIFIVAGLVVLLAVITLGLSRLEPAAPTVERATLWIDTVRRGDMLRQVRGSGSLVPEQVRWIPAGTEGRVERILVEAGSAVTATTAVLELSNPELQLAAQDAQGAVAASEAELANLKVQLQSQQLAQESAAASAQASYATAKLRAEANEQLASQGLIAGISLKESQVTAEELSIRNNIEQKRVAMAGEAARAQIAVQQARLGQLRGAALLKRQQVEALRVQAGIDGVLQQVPVEVGQRVTAGQTLAKIAEPGRLKAAIRVPETQARDIQLGQNVSVDTRNGLVPGKVSRIDPAVVNGTVQVDVTLAGPLPRGARPDLSVDGTIELEKLENILYVGRPALGQEQSKISLYRIVEAMGGALRVPVTLGRSSVGTIEVVDGLNPGDQVILSDMSAWDAYDRVRLR